MSSTTLTVREEEDNVKEEDALTRKSTRNRKDLSAVSRTEEDKKHNEDSGGDLDLEVGVPEHLDDFVEENERASSIVETDTDPVENLTQLENKVTESRESKPKKRKLLKRIWLNLRKWKGLKSSWLRGFVTFIVFSIGITTYAFIASEEKWAGGSILILTFVVIGFYAVLSAIHLNDESGTVLDWEEELSKRNHDRSSWISILLFATSAILTATQNQSIRILFIVLTGVTGLSIAYCIWSRYWNDLVILELFIGVESIVCIYLGVKGFGRSVELAFGILSIVSGLLVAVFCFGLLAHRHLVSRRIDSNDKVQGRKSMILWFSFVLIDISCIALLGTRNLAGRNYEEYEVVVAFLLLNPIVSEATSVAEKKRFVAQLVTDELSPEQTKKLRDFDFKPSLQFIATACAIFPMLIALIYADAFGTFEWLHLCLPGMITAGWLLYIHLSGFGSRLHLLIRDILPRYLLCCWLLYLVQANALDPTNELHMLDTLLYVYLVYILCSVTLQLCVYTDNYCKKKPKLTFDKVLRGIVRNPFSVVLFLGLYLVTTGIAIAFILFQNSTILLAMFSLCFVTLGALSPLIATDEVLNKRKLRERLEQIVEDDFSFSFLRMLDRVKKWLVKDTLAIRLVLMLEVSFDIFISLGSFQPNDKAFRFTVAGVSAASCAFIILLFERQIRKSLEKVSGYGPFEYRNILEKSFSIASDNVRLFAIALSDTADILLFIRPFARDVIVISEKEIIIFIFLVMNVVLSELQTIFFTVLDQSAEVPPEEIVESNESRRKKLRNVRLANVERLRENMQRKARLQAFLVGGLGFPFVLVVLWRHMVSNIESAMVFATVMLMTIYVTDSILVNGFEIDTSCNMLNYAQKELVVRAFGCFWLFILASTKLIHSLNEVQKLAFLFSSIYWLIPLCFRTAQLIVQYPIYTMSNREIGGEDRIYDKGTSLLLRSPFTEKLLRLQRQRLSVDQLNKCYLKAYHQFAGYVPRSFSVLMYSLLEQRKTEDVNVLLSCLTGLSPFNQHTHLLQNSALPSCSSVYISKDQHRFESMKTFLYAIAQTKNSSLVSLQLREVALTTSDAWILGSCLASEECKLNEIFFIGNNIGDEGAQSIGEGIKQSRTLQTLILIDNDIGDEGAQLIGEGLKQSKSLQTLDLSENQIGPEGAQSIGEGLKQSKTLQMLSLDGNNIGPKGAQSIGESLKQSRTLQTLNLGGNHLGDEGTGKIGKGLKQSISLATLHLGGNSIGDKGAQSLGVLIGQSKTLQKLYLGGNKIGPEGARSIVEGLKQSKVFQTLGLDDNNIGRKGAQSIGEGLRKSKTLQTLYLRNNMVGPKGGQSIGEGLGLSNTLQTLYLSGNNIGNEGTESIGKGLRESLTLQKLGLDDNNIGPEGAKSVGVGLRHSKTLQTLYMGNNYIGPKGAQSIGDGLKESRTLQTLDLDSNNIGPKGAQSIGNGLKESRTLQTLNLRSNNFGPEGARSIGDALKESKTLQTLSLQNNNIGDEEVANITDIAASRSIALTA